MKYSIENNRICAEVDSHGAELCSLFGKKRRQEYLWWADPHYWNRSSPVLFPFVGRLKDHAYQYQGRHYTMKQHGFARDMEFRLQSHTSEKVSFELTDTKESRGIYPFFFRLVISYVLHDDRLLVNWKVWNKGRQEMHFAIGSHPAFLCPLDGSKQCRIHLGEKKKYIYQQLDNDFLCQPEKHILQAVNGIWAFDKSIFDKDVFIFPDGQLEQIDLLDEKERPYLSVLSHAPLTGIWSKPGMDAPFLCIEPWFGRCDRSGNAISLEYKDYINHLAPGAGFEAGYAIKIYE